MTFTFTTTIPAANNNPSDDQPDMLQNNVSTDAIIAVDHVSFNTDQGGTHKQVTITSKNTPGAQADPVSTIFTASGTASPVADLNYKNANGTFIPSTIRAWAACTDTGILASQSMNVATFVRNSTGNYTVTLTANAVNSVNFAVLMGTAQYSNVQNYGYAILGIGQIRFTFFSNLTPVDVATFSFQVMQL